MLNTSTINTRPNMKVTELSSFNTVLFKDLEVGDFFERIEFGYNGLYLKINNSPTNNAIRYMDNLKEITYVDPNIDVREVSEILYKV